MYGDELRSQQQRICSDIVAELLLDICFQLYMLHYETLLSVAFLINFIILVVDIIGFADIDLLRKKCLMACFQIVHGWVGINCDIYTECFQCC